LILGAFAFAAFGQGWNPFSRASQDGNVLRVGIGDGGVATIGEALAQAGEGATVLVAPGQYREALQLRDGVRLVSAVPGGAAILPPPGSGVPAVTAQGVEDARIEGFRIAGDVQAPLQVGIRLADSSVEIENVEISGAVTAGIDVVGQGVSTIRYSHVHDNPGGGVLVEGGAAPRLLHNLIVRNGRAPGAPPRPGVEVRDQARPALIENRIEGNGGGGVSLPSVDRSEEIFLWNSFGASGRAEAVRTPAPPAAPAPAAPQPAPQAPRRRGRGR
jgi:parallel beta helix pectate lyase-like protein